MWPKCLWNFIEIYEPRYTVPSLAIMRMVVRSRVIAEIFDERRISNATHLRAIFKIDVRHRLNNCWQFLDQCYRREKDPASVAQRRRR